MATSTTMALSSLSPLQMQTNSLPKHLLHSQSSSITTFSFSATPQQNVNQNTTLPTTTSTSSVVPSEKWRTYISFFPDFLKNKTKDAQAIKEELLEAIAPLDRGVEATPEDQQRVDQVCSCFFLLFRLHFIFIFFFCT